MISWQELRDELIDEVMDKVSCDDKIAFCEGCELIENEPDIGYADCPYGMDIGCCEKSPFADIEKICGDMASAIIDAKP